MAALAGGARITGLNRLVNDLTAMGVEVDDLKNAFGHIARQGAQVAGALAPVQTGALARSVRGSAARNYAAVSAGGRAVRYAGPINYGWRKRNIQPSRFMQRADIIMRPYAIRELAQAVERLASEVNEPHGQPLKLRPSRRVRPPAQFAGPDDDADFRH